MKAVDITMIYYIDMQNGDPAADGHTPENARLGYEGLSLQPGDSVLFRRGNVIRGELKCKSGTPDAYITYGAYGEGRNPAFIGSVDVSAPDDWEEIRPNVWQYQKHLDSEACNFIFDNGRIGGTLRWEEDLLSAPGDWFDSRMGAQESRATYETEKVLLFSEGNPGHVYSHIECAVFGSRCLSRNTDCTAIEDLIFFGSGVHALSGGARHMTVRRCSFGYIGGAVWNRQLRIRFGNAIEFWNYGEDILIEDCYFNNIYDSCITQQGGNDCLPAKNLVMRRCLFLNYGMGAYEGRDRMPVSSAFRDNLCIHAGGGFSGFGDTVPRNSEIYPQPMGHHLFIWRMTAPSPGGSLSVENNRFYDFSGAAVYSIIDPDADAQMVFGNNTYLAESQPLLNCRAWKTYSTEAYRAEKEPGAVFADSPDFRAEADAWFASSHADNMGMPVFTD